MPFAVEFFEDGKRHLAGDSSHIGGRGYDAYASEKDAEKRADFIRNEYNSVLKRMGKPLATNVKVIKVARGF